MIHTQLSSKPTTHHLDISPTKHLLIVGYGNGYPSDKGTTLTSNTSQGKRNPADSLSRQSVTDALVKKSSVHDANEAYVQQLRVAVDASDAEIQKSLTRLFSKNTNINQDQDSVIEMSTTTEEQKTAGILDKIRPSGQTEISSNSDQSCPRQSKCDD